MAVTVYKALKHRILSGKKIYTSGEWKVIPDNAKIFLGGQWRGIGFSSSSSSGETGLEFDNGIEPSSGNVFYITPNGNGTMDGSSWGNAAPASQVHAILLSCVSGDSVYFSEGEYTTDRVMDIPSGVTLYGGFKNETPTWETRNGFVHQSIFSGSSNFGMSTGGTVDGLTIKGYSRTGYSEYKNCISNVDFDGTATNCAAVNGGGFSGKATNCMAVNGGGFSGKATNCTAVNGGGFSSTATNCMAVNGGGFSGKATNCMAINCNIFQSRAFLFEEAINCIAVNCSASGSSLSPVAIFGDTAKNCTAVNCSLSGGKVNSSAIFYRIAAGFKFQNCLSWNNDGTEFSHPEDSTTCAGSTYNSALTLTLGTDNSIARFTNTGFAPAKGVQDVGACPSPLDDPTGYAEWLSAFGDWHPAADSFLLGAGTADSSVTTDADGVTRPDPPAIGAYEAKPTQETIE